MNDKEIVAWVAEAGSADERSFREAVHTILFAIASSASLQPQMIMKGGILMAIRYETGRFTRDIDFSTPLHYQTFEAGEGAFLEMLDKAIQEAAAKMPYQLDCRQQSFRLQPKREGGNFQTLHISIGYAYFGTNEHKRLIKKQAIKTVQVDYSFNEEVHDMDLLCIDDGNVAVQVYGELTQIAEKLRAILQQPERNRARGQDVYDLHHVLSNYPIEGSARKALLLEVLKGKARSRDIEASPDSMADPRIKERSVAAYEELRATVEGELPDFEEAFMFVRKFYEELPW